MKKYVLLFLTAVCLTTIARSQTFQSSPYYSNGGIAIQNVYTIKSCDSLFRIPFFTQQSNAYLTQSDFIVKLFSSIGSTYSATVLVDWGDGSSTSHFCSSVVPTTSAELYFSPAIEHVYTNHGTYPISVTTSTSFGQTSTWNNYQFDYQNCETYFIPPSGSASVPCGTNVQIFDEGGFLNAYEDNSDGYIVLNNSGNGQITLSGYVAYLDDPFDRLTISPGTAPGQANHLFLSAYYSNPNSPWVDYVLPTITSQPGQPLTLRFESDSSFTFSGFAISATYSGSCANYSVSAAGLTQLDCDADGINEDTLTIPVPIALVGNGQSYTTSLQNNAIGIPSVIPGNYSIVVDPNWLSSNGYSVNLVSPSTIQVNSNEYLNLSIELVCAANANLSCLDGGVFCDANGNGVKDSTEIPVFNAAVSAEINNQVYTTYTDGTGNYQLSYPASTGDSVNVEINANWMFANGTSSNGPTNYEITSVSCDSLQQPSLNFPMNCTSNLPFNCFAGKVFCDANFNSVFDSGELVYAFVPVHLSENQSNGPQVTVYTDSLGQFEYCGQISSTNLISAWIDSSWLASMNYSIINQSVTVVGTSSGNPSVVAVPFNCSAYTCTDMVVFGGIFGNYFQNTVVELIMGWGSTGPLPAGNYQVQLTYPSLVTPITSTFDNQNFTISGNTITWNFTSASSNFWGFDLISFQLPAGLINGVEHTYTLTVFPESTEDCSTQNNTSVFNVFLGNSYDPNDKQASRLPFYTNSLFTPNELDPTIQDELTYMIRFQNTGSAPAQNIYIIDTLSPNLDWTSFYVQNASHNCNVIHLGNGVVRFDFPQIWLPDSTTNALESQGFITYRIREKSTCQLGCSIENTAYIYFDWNEAIITNTTSHLNTQPSGLFNNEELKLQVFPNPFSEELNIVFPGEFLVDILSLSGSSVLTSNGTNNCAIKTDGLQSGVYLLKIISSSGEEMKKLVKW